MSENTQTNELWEVPKYAEGRNMPAEVHDRWQEISLRLRDYAAEHNLKRSQLVKAIGIPSGTLYDLLKGTYRGVYEDKLDAIETWLNSEIEAAKTKTAMLQPPGFIETPTAKEVLNALIYAQTAPTMGIVTLPSGLGKSRTIEHMLDTRSNAFLVTMNEMTSSPWAMVRAIAKVVDVKTKGSTEQMLEQVGLRLKRNGRHTLLMVDEAQVLTDRAVNQLRFFYDLYGVGIVLLGNREIYNRYGGQAPQEGYGQIHSRIGIRVLRLRPTDEDIAMYVSAWNFENPEIDRLLTVIGRTPGSLRQIRETVTLANIIAVGRNEELGPEHIKMAWRNRGNTEL